MLGPRPGPGKPRRGSPAAGRAALSALSSPPAPASPTPAPGSRAAPHAPAAGSGRAPSPAKGWAGGGGEGARATLAQVARRGLGTEGLNQVCGHLPASAPSPELGAPAPRRPAAHREKPRDTPPQPGAQGFCFGRDENNDP